MRDIRSDLQERAALIDQQIKAAYDHFERSVQQLQSDHDAKTGELNSTLAMVKKFMEFEERNMANVAPRVPDSPLVALADRFMHMVNNAGQVSREELIDISVKEG